MNHFMKWFCCSNTFCSSSSWIQEILLLAYVFVKPAAASKVLVSVRGHMWYLQPELDVLCLFWWYGLETREEDRCWCVGGTNSSTTLSSMKRDFGVYDSLTERHPSKPRHLCHWKIITFHQTLSLGQSRVSHWFWDFAHVSCMPGAQTSYTRNASSE